MKNDNFLKDFSEARSFREILKKKTLFRDFAIEKTRNLAENNDLIEKTGKNLPEKKSDSIENSLKKRCVSLHALNLSKILQITDSFLPISERKTLNSYRIQEKRIKKSQSVEPKKKQLPRANLPLKYRSEKIFLESRLKDGKKRSISLHFFKNEKELDKKCLH